MAAKLRAKQEQARLERERKRALQAEVCICMQIVCPGDRLANMKVYLSGAVFRDNTIHIGVRISTVIAFVELHRFSGSGCKAKRD